MLADRCEPADVRVRDARCRLAEPPCPFAVERLRFAEALFDEPPCCRLVFEDDFVAAIVIFFPSPWRA